MRPRGKETGHEETEFQDLIEYRELDPSEAVFSAGGDGFMSLSVNGQQYERVELVRLLPFNRPEEYISCIAEGTEVGIIRRVNDFPEQQQKVIRDQLFFRYYAPKIEKILSVREKMWFLFIKAVVNGTETELCLRDMYHNIRYYNVTDVMLIDVEENRYLIGNFAQLPKKLRQKLEIYL